MASGARDGRKDRWETIAATANRVILFFGDTQTKEANKAKYSRQICLRNDPSRERWTEESMVKPIKTIETEVLERVKFKYMVDIVKMKHIPLKEFTTFLGFSGAIIRSSLNKLAERNNWGEGIPGKPFRH